MNRKYNYLRKECRRESKEYLESKLKSMNRLYNEIKDDDRFTKNEKDDWEMRLSIIKQYLC